MFCLHVESPWQEVLHCIVSHLQLRHIIAEDPRYSQSPLPCVSTSSLGNDLASERCQSGQLSLIDDARLSLIGVAYALDRRGPGGRLCGG